MCGTTYSFAITVRGGSAGADGVCVVDLKGTSKAVLLHRVKILLP